MTNSSDRRYQSKKKLTPQASLPFSPPVFNMHVRDNFMNMMVVVLMTTMMVVMRRRRMRRRRIPAQSMSEVMVTPLNADAQTESETIGT